MTCEGVKTPHAGLGSAFTASSPGSLAACGAMGLSRARLPRIRIRAVPGLSLQSKLGGACSIQCNVQYTPFVEHVWLV